MRTLDDRIGLSWEEKLRRNRVPPAVLPVEETLPYPRHLREVPLIAGCHHEKMDVGGYPKRLTSAEIPLAARMMAIADIFEALTASDRPYKKAKTLSEAVHIMHRMKVERHIDLDLFELLLAGGVHLEYGRRFPRPEQLDEVDIGRYLGGLAAARGK
jgi:HD domain